MSKVKSLIKQLSNASENLSVENKKKFGDIILFIRMSNIKIIDAEEFLQQLLDSFLNAEKKGVTIERVLGTSDIKQYCEEIVLTYKSSYNFLSLCSQYIMYAGMFIVILSTITYIMDNFTLFMINGANNLSLNLNFDSGLILQFLIVAPVVIAGDSYIKKSCFKEPSNNGKVKTFFKNWLLGILLIAIMLPFYLLVGDLILFKLNIIIVLIIGISLYYIGKSFSEK